MRKILYTLSVLLGFSVTTAQAQFSISAEIRPRTEFRNGFKTLRAEGDDPAFFTEQRSRLYLSYLDEKYELKLTLQDIRSWGENPQIFKQDEAANTFIADAWGKYNFTDVFSIKVGRQMLSYDNQRFLGGLEWAQQGRRHDAVLAMWEKPNMHLHIGVGFNQDDDIPEPRLLQGPSANYYSVNGNYKTMQFAHFNKKFTDGEMSVLVFSDGFQNADSSTSFRQTWGLIGSKKIGNVTLKGDLYYQSGEFANNDVNALLAGFNATFTTDITPITLGVEYISGKDGDDTDSDVTNFRPDYGTNHAFNGYMDYFFVGPANGNVGVTDLYLKTKFKAMGGALVANAHHFLTGSDQFNNEGDELSSSMGTEVDLVYIKNFKGGVKWHLGFSSMFPTDTMESLRSKEADGLQFWGWTMLTFKPTLFTSVKK